jgi:hypothetical protein
MKASIARTRWLSATLALCVIAAVSLAAAASAAQISSGTFHEEKSFVFHDFCGVSGLTVEGTHVIDLRVQVVDRSQGTAPPYFLEHASSTDVFTNPDNGKSVTQMLNALQKDLRITDNGDGTITITALATGNAVLYGPDGRAIARDPGQIRFQILIDTAGTPADPDDDVELAFLGVVKDSTGRTDDFCDAAVTALT